MDMRRMVMVIAAFVLIGFTQICRAEDCVDYSNSPDVTGRLYLKCPITFIYCTKEAPYINDIPRWFLGAKRIELIQKPPHTGTIQCTLTNNPVAVPQYGAEYPSHIHLNYPEVLNSNDLVTGIVICTPVGSFPAPQGIACNTWFEKH